MAGEDQKGAASERGQLSTVEMKLIEGQVIEAARMCYDPEIPVNIYDMGLVYDVTVAADGGVLVVMTLTSPHCPAAQSLPIDVENRIKMIPGVTAVVVKVVWDPPWNPSMMTEAARLELGLM
ncbi:MAG TPA: iron-sulfur cluster assembly protein [Bacteroidota bacterium]|nr:iron-sulfur cluster assembly protein [Bacteroidota bacterium]